MARRPRSSAPAMETRVSIGDPRVTFVPVPNARKLVVIEDRLPIPEEAFQIGALVWIKPQPGSSEATLADLKARLSGAAAVRVLPGSPEVAALPAAAGSPAPTSDVSEVRPVVAELVAELPEALREGVAASCDRYLSEAGL